MPDQQLYFAVGLPILVNLLTSCLIMLYVGHRLDKLVEKVGELDARVAVLEDRAK